MIKPIDEIPENLIQQRISYRERVRTDIQAALDQKIYKFEFVGNYNFKTLQNLAAEIADRMVMTIARKWMNEHPEYKERCNSIFNWGTNSTLKLIRISSIKGETPEKRRVFCRIREDMYEAIEEYAKQKCREYEERKARKEGIDDDCDLCAGQESEW